MSQKLTTPIGRLIWGSLYEPQTKDFDGNPLTVKTPGPDFGKPTQRFSFGVAIPKGSEQHWSQTPWGQIIWAEGVLFPNGAASRNDFSWKITDGDSTGFKKGGTKPINTLSGYAGNWVLSFSSSFPPKLYKDNGQTQLVEPGFIKCGYYVQVAGSVSGNGNTNNPGVFLNHDLVCFQAYGEEIYTGADPLAAGFGGALPAGASAAPTGASFAPAGYSAPPAMPAPPAAAQAPMPPAVPVAGGLPLPPGAPVAAPAPAPAPAPVKPVLVQVPGAQYTIEQCRAGGWTDQQLIDNGIARWETPSGVQPVPSFLTGPQQ